MKIGDSPPVGRTAIEGKGLQQKPSSAQNISDSSNLPGVRLIKGTVLSPATPDGQVLISVAGRTVNAGSPLPLQVGQELWFEVLRDGEPPLIRLAGKQGAAVDLLRLLSSFGVVRDLTPGGGLTDTLFQSLQSMDPKSASEIERFLRLFSESAIDAEPDPAKILKSGFAVGLFDKLPWSAGENAKAKLQRFDLLSFLAEKGGAAAGSDGEESKAVARLLKLFESFVHLNNQPARQDQQNFLIFPCFFSGASGWGEWLLSFDKEQEDGGDSGSRYGLSFFLELSNLGELHLRIHIRHNALQGVFSVPDEDAVRHVSENLQELSKILKNIGFHPVNLSCQVAHAAHIQSLKAQLAELADRGSLALVDVTI